MHRKQVGDGAAVDAAVGHFLLMEHCAEVSGESP